MFVRVSLEPRMGLKSIVPCFRLYVKEKIARL